MSLFGALPIAESGMLVSQTWLDAVGGNIANANDVVAVNQPAYQARFIVAQPVQPIPTPGEVDVGQGVDVQNVVFSSPAGVIAYDPTSKLANAQGLVKYPLDRLGDQMVAGVMAQNAYQADVAVAKRADSAYQSALTLGS